MTKDELYKIASDNGFFEITQKYCFVKGAQYILSTQSWIDVNLKLPKEEGVSYLVCVKNKNKEGGIPIIDVGYFEEGIFHKSNTWERVTHWMPLPEPPKV